MIPTATASAELPSAPPAALEGLRVLDLSGPLGNYCGKLFGDLGAEVILVEPPSGTRLRFEPPFLEDTPGLERSLAFAYHNTSKRGISLNLDSVTGQELLRRLVAGTDVIIETEKPGVMRARALDYEALARVRPELVYTSITPFGQTGPYAQHESSDLIALALGGLLYLGGYPDAAPVRAYGNQHDWAAPHGVYPCVGEDRWIAIAAMDDLQWAALVEVLGSPAWAAQPRWNTAIARRRDCEKLDRLLARETVRWGAEELMAALQARGVAAGVVQNTEDVIKHDPQLAHRGHWIRLNHAEMGEALYNAPPFRFSRTPVELRAPAPLLGEHTREVCVGLLGISETEVDELIAQGVLK